MTIGSPGQMRRNGTEAVPRKKQEASAGGTALPADARAGEESGGQGPVPEQPAQAEAAGEPEERPAEANSGEAMTTEDTATESRVFRRMHTAVTLSVALASVLTAVASWRVETHAAAATELDQDVVAAQIASASNQDDANLQAQSAQSQYHRFLRLADDESLQAPSNQPFPNCQSDNPSTFQTAVADVDCQLQYLFSQSFYSNYTDFAQGANTDSDLPRNFKVDAYAADVAAVNKEVAGSESAAVLKAEDDSERHNEDVLLWGTVIFVAALALFTLGQLERRLKRLTLLMGAGWAAAVAGIALLVVVEF